MYLLDFDLADASPEPGDAQPHRATLNKRRIVRLPWLARSSLMQRVIREGQDATGQITLRWAVVLLFVLLAMASRFGLDVVLGAMLAEIGMQDGVMLPATAAALVGAGVLSVLIFPLIAVRLHRTAPLTPADVGITHGTDPDDPPVARPVR